MFYAAVASALWVTIFRGAGSWFGTAEWVQDYLAIALAVIVIASALPGPVVWAVIVRAGAQTSRGEARTPSVARAGAGGPSRHRCRGHSLHRASSP